MEWTKLNPGDDSTIVSVDRLDFDTIRTIASIRQSNCLTVKAVCASHIGESGGHAMSPQSSMDLINGRNTYGNVHNSGMFASAQSAAITHNGIRIK